MSELSQVILLIDDSEANNLLNKRLITKFYTKCSAVKIELNGKKGIDYINGVGVYANREQYPLPDVILLDINMPVMDGLEFMEEFVKVKKGLPFKIKVYMLTSSIVDNDKLKAERLGVDGFIIKPLTKKTFETVQF